MHADLRLEAASVAFNRYIEYFISACMTLNLLYVANNAEVAPESSMFPTSI
jgi:hypothetical protein